MRFELGSRARTVEQTNANGSQTNRMRSRAIGLRVPAASAGRSLGCAFERRVTPDDGALRVRGLRARAFARRGAAAVVVAGPRFRAFPVFAVRGAAAADAGRARFFSSSPSDRNTQPDCDPDVTSAGTSNEGVDRFRERGIGHLETTDTF